MQGAVSVGCNFWVAAAKQSFLRSPSWIDGSGPLGVTVLFHRQTSATVSFPFNNASMHVTDQQVLRCTSERNATPQDIHQTVAQIVTAVLVCARLLCLCVGSVDS